MSEIILRINDAMSLDRMVSLLAPYIEKAEIRQAPAESQPKIWTGKAEWLDNPVRMDSFTPLSRIEAHAR